VATIYVSYRSTEERFVRAVVSKLEQRHDVRIDYNMPAGVDWRSHQIEDLRTCDVFLVFVSRDTRTSDFQNSEMGGARFCQAYVDSKTLIPVLIEPAELPIELMGIQYLHATQDPRGAAVRLVHELLRRSD